MFDTKFKKKGIILSVIPLYFIVSLFVPLMNLFTYSSNDTSSFISTGKLILTHKFKNDPFGKGLRAFFVDGLDTNFLIEIFWYGMMVQFLTAVLFLFGISIFWLSKKNRKTGYNILNFTGILYSLAVLVELILVLIAKITVPDNVNFALNYNIPFVLITVALCAVFIVVVKSMKNNFKEPKLRTN